MNDLTPFNHLTDYELCTLIRYRPSQPILDPLIEELVRRLEDAIDLIEETDSNLAALQAKYGISDEDLYECELTPPSSPIGRTYGNDPRRQG